MLGGFTALVGVFYITGNKIEDVSKAVILGLVFGFSFNSVLQYLNESQTRTLKLEQAEGSTAELTRENARLRAELRERDLPGDETPEQLVSIRSAEAEQILGGLQEMTTRSARTKFEHYSKESILELEKAAQRLSSRSEVRGALRNLGEVGARAVPVSEDVALQAVESIGAVTRTHLEKAATADASVELQMAGDSSLKDVARAAERAGRTSIMTRGLHLRVQNLGRTVQLWRTAFDDRQYAQIQQTLMELKGEALDAATQERLQAIADQLGGGRSRVLDL